MIGFDFSDNGACFYLMNNHNEYFRNLSFPFETKINNNFMTGVHQLQSNYPQELDGSFLTLGIGGTADTMSRCNISGVEGTPMMSPQSNTSNILSVGNYLYPSFNMAGRFSDSRSVVDGQTFLGNGARVMSGVDSRFLSNPNFTAQTSQNDQWQDFDPVNQLYQGHSAISSIARSIQLDLPGNDQRVSSGVSSGSLSNTYYIAETPQDDQWREFDPVPRRENAVLEGINFNYDYQGLSAISSIPRSTELGLFGNDQRVVSGVRSRFRSNPQYVLETPQGDPGPTRENARLGAINFNYDYQGHSSISSIARSNQLGLPDSRQGRETGFPSVSNLRRTPTQPATGQSQNFYTETLWPHKTGIVTGGLCEPQVTGPLQLSRTLNATGHGISNFSVTNINSISQACSVSTRPPLKSDAMQSSQTINHSQHENMRKYYVGPTILAPAQPPPNSSGFGFHTAQAHDERSSLYQANNTIFPPLPQTASQFSQPWAAPQFLQQPQTTPFLSSFSLPVTTPSRLQSWAASPIPPQPETGTQFISQSQIATQFLSQLQTAPQILSQPQNASQIVSQPRTAPQLLKQALAPPNILRRTQNTRRRSPRTSPLRTSMPVQQIEHINWQDETSKRIGHKCFICKRDLSLSADGSVFRSNLLVPSAILPCGHTFHDHCLQLNTPPDQATNPPCIHCSKRES
ncbi:uncharacterized protein LOC133796494 isoform X2 [Humulus lupulus]|uniref:uncharacterized protein LOC133796494 isoform X2 n=1 Tax=Humulus lupulus TaxID=3486 RepID=UPI002B40B795|nr:uncharacterized protein LOC133796494 isoform X2 [Humulus lupulus]